VLRGAFDKQLLRISCSTSSPCHPQFIVSDHPMPSSPRSGPPPLRNEVAIRRPYGTRAEPEDSVARPIPSGDRPLDCSEPGVRWGGEQAQRRRGAIARMTARTTSTPRNTSRSGSSSSPTPRPQSHPAHPPGHHPNSRAPEPRIMVSRY
jgi:hypothetical protein